MLVAGVTGGASLIKSAKIRSFINELNGYKTAVYTFRIAKDRLPGDLNGDGKIGHDSGETYDKNSFPSPYNVASGDYQIPNVYSAPWVDLYLEGIIDFQPKKTATIKDGGEAEKGLGLPYSDTLKVLHYFEYPTSSSNSTNSKYNIAGKNYITSVGVKHEMTIQPEILKNIDEKIDDGKYNDGNFRGWCSTNGDVSYEYSIDNKILCLHSYFAIE